MTETVFDIINRDHPEVLNRIFAGYGTESDFLTVSAYAVKRTGSVAGSSLCCEQDTFKKIFISKLPVNVFQNIPGLVATPAISLIQHCLVVNPSLEEPQNFYTLENFLLSTGFITVSDAGAFLAKMPEITPVVFHQMVRAHINTLDWYYLSRVVQRPGVVENLRLTEDIHGLPDSVVHYLVHTKLMQEGVPSAKATLIAELVLQDVSISDAKLAILA